MMSIELNGRNEIDLKTELIPDVPPICSNREVINVQLLQDEKNPR